MSILRGSVFFWQKHTTRLVNLDMKSNKEVALCGAMGPGTYGDSRELVLEWKLLKQYKA